MMGVRDHLFSKLFGHRMVAVFVTTLFLLAFPHPVLAQVSLGDMMCSVATNLMPSSLNEGAPDGIVSLIVGFAYISGIFFIGTGLMQLSRHHEGDREVKWHHPIARMVGGAFLISMPSVMGWLLTTFALQAQGQGIYTAKPCQSVYEPVDGLTPDSMIENLAWNISAPMTLMLSVMAVVIGAVYIYKGLVRAAKYGTDPKASSVPNILVHLFVGSILVTCGTSLDFVFNTIFGIGYQQGGGPIILGGSFWNSAPVILFFASIDPNLDPTDFEYTVSAALTLFQLVGFIAFIRGWMILKSSVEGTGQTTIAQGLTHIFGGAMAVNIYQVLEILMYTFSGIQT